MRKIDRMTNTIRVTVILILCCLVITACAPTVKLETPQEPEVQNQTKSKPLKPASPVSTKKMSADETALQTACKETWQAYSREYQNRYKV